MQLIVLFVFFLSAIHSKFSVHAVNNTNIYTTSIGLAYLLVYRNVLNKEEKKNSETSKVYGLDFKTIYTHLKNY